jgi:hypothetical protein
VLLVILIGVVGADVAAIVVAVAVVVTVVAAALIVAAGVVVLIAVADAAAVIVVADAAALIAVADAAVEIVAADVVDPLVAPLPFAAEVRQRSLVTSFRPRMLDPSASNVQDMGLPGGWLRSSPIISRPNCTREQSTITTVWTSLPTRKNALNRSSACSALCSG